MKMLSYNVRGLGEGAKRRVIREVVCKHHVDFSAFKKRNFKLLTEGLVHCYGEILPLNGKLYLL